MNKITSEDIVIIGFGGFGREVQWLIKRINQKNRDLTGCDRWNLLGFVDDNISDITTGEISILGGCDWLAERKEDTAVVCAVGAANVREKIINRIKGNSSLTYPNLIDPSVIYSETVEFGRGNIICAGTILTVTVNIGDFCIINLDCTIGHDTRLESYVTLYPSVNLSGCVSIGKCSEIGTGSHIIQGVEIRQNVTVGAGAVVIRDLQQDCTAVGNPAKIIKLKR